MDFIYINLIFFIGLIALIAVCALIFVIRAQRWTHRRQEWEESERGALMEMEAGKHGRIAVDPPKFNPPRKA